MCDPVTLGTVATVATIGGGAYSAYNQYQSGRAEENYYNSLAQSQQQQGQYALEQGQRQSSAIQDSAKVQGKQLATESAQFNASQRAAMAAAGIQGVTAEDIEYDALNKQKLDEAALRYNADIKSWEAQTGAQYDDYQYREQARQSRVAGKNARKAGKTNAFSTLLSTASSVANSGMFKIK